MKAQASAGSVEGMSVHDNTWHSEDFETTTGAQAKADSAESNAKSYVDSNLPTGIISMWSGTITTIPSTWALCDGTNGTPDLRDRFIVGAGSSYSVGDTGGADSVTLTEAQLPSHNHDSGTLANSSAGVHTHDSGTLGTNSTGAHTHDSGTLVNNSTGAHTHTWSGTSSSTGSHSHSGSTNTTGNHAHDLPNAYYSTDGTFRILKSYSGYTPLESIRSGYILSSGNHSHSLSINSAGAHTHTISGTTSSNGSHSHTISGSTASAGAHSHSISGNTGSSGSHSHTISGSTASTGSGSSHENRPPFYALAYIMKL
jgi:microcystin-dependent protein